MAVIQERAAPADGPPYSFSSQPRVVAHRRKYRNAEFQNPEEETRGFGNIMYDRRVVRGNTYASSTLPARAQPDPVEIQRQQESKRRAIARRRAKEHFQSLTPEPVAGRKHIDVQTEFYLEELADRIEEADVDCQTDGFLDRPPSPLFVPAKSGADASTQILDGELFDFDIEVKPILEVLVGKTLEQSLIEVLEEEELANLRIQQREFLELRNAELAEQQRLEEQERRHREEKNKRMEQQKEVIKKEKETAEKIAAMAFAKSYLRDLVPTVFATLSDNGYFYDPVEKDVEQGMLPWLMENVMSEMDRYTLSRKLIDAMLRDIIKNRKEGYDKLEEEIMSELERKENEQEKDVANKTMAGMIEQAQNKREMDKEKTEGETAADADLQFEREEDEVDREEVA